MWIPMRPTFCKEFCLLRAYSFTENYLLRKCCYGRHYIDFSYFSRVLIISGIPIFRNCV